MRAPSVRPNATPTQNNHPSLFSLSLSDWNWLLVFHILLKPVVRHTHILRGVMLFFCYKQKNHNKWFKQTQNSGTQYSFELPAQHSQEKTERKTEMRKPPFGGWDLSLATYCFVLFHLIIIIVLCVYVCVWLSILCLVDWMTTLLLHRARLLGAVVVAWFLLLHFDTLIF